MDTRSTPDPQEGFGKEEPELNSTSASVRDYPHSWKTYLGWRNHLLRGKNCLLRSRRRRRRNLAPEEVREDGGEGISHNVFLSFNVGFNFATNYNFFLSFWFSKGMASVVAL